MKKVEVPVWEKANLTVSEAAAYFEIGTKKIRMQHIFYGMEVNY